VRSRFLVVVTFGTLSLFALGCRPSHEGFLGRVAALSGTQAVDCGYVPIGKDLAPSLACLTTQVSGSRPFRVAVETYGLENILVFAVVRTVGGQLRYVSYDPDACSHNCWFKRPQIVEGDCPRPQVVNDPDGGFARDPIECARAGQ
jgi:hypothetical protein